MINITFRVYAFTSTENIELHAHAYFCFSLTDQSTTILEEKTVKDYISIELDKNGKEKNANG
jgi:hypothetical protein